MIASGSADNRVCLWNLQGELLGQFVEEQKGYINTVAFRSDRQTLIIGNANKTMRLWDTQLRQGESWEVWLQVCCNRFRAHPVFKNPQTDVEKQACETCRKYVWDK
jgi:WD40 repeat protein